LRPSEFSGLPLVAGFLVPDAHPLMEFIARLK